MKQITFIKKGFPKSENGTSQLPFSVKALLRAVIAAGRKPARVKRTSAARSDISMRISALKSALDMRGARLVPTREYLTAGSTDKAIKSFYVGNALCSHAAYLRLAIPWLVDFERLDGKYKVRISTKSRRRPDFLGKDTGARWFTFECKGRSSSPGPADLKAWKKQTRTVDRVNGCGVEQGIVSAAYIQKTSEWELKWVDPPADENAAEVSFDEMAFFDAYYQPIVSYIEQRGARIETLAEAVSLSGRDVFVGLHREILAALRARSDSAILSFASRMNTLESVGPDGSSLFRDGLIIKLGPEWEQGGNDPMTQLNVSPSGSRRQPPASVQMTPHSIGQPERATQDRVIALFRDELHYRGTTRPFTACCATVCR